ncbi:MAG TPA: glycosyltransferase family 39 protein [Longimicrobium sp.]
MSASPRRSRFAAAAVWTVVILCLAAGIGAWVFSMIRFEAFQAFVDSLAGDGDAGTFDRGVFDSLIAKVRILGTALLLAGAAAWAKRGWLERGLTRVGGDIGGFLADATGRARRGWAASEPIHRWTLYAIIAAAVAVRLVFIRQPMRYDEAYTFLEFASRPIYIGLSNYSAVNNHLFHTLLVHLSWLVFGNQPWALRLAALIAGVMVVPAAYLAARMLYNRNAGLIAAGLAAGSSILIEYSTNARGYTLITLIFLLLLALAAHLMESPSRGGWLVYAVLGALGFWTIPVMLYPFGVVCLWVLITALLAEPARRRALIAGLFASVGVAVVLVLILYSPVFTVFGVGAVTGNEVVASKSWSFFARGVPGAAGILWRQWHRDIPLVLGLLLAAGAIAGWVLNRRIGSARIAPALAAVGWIAPVLILQLVIPEPRIWLFLLPLYFAMAGAGWMALLGRVVPAGRQPMVAAAVALGVTLLLCARVVASESVLRSTETGTLRDANEIAAELRGRIAEGDRVVAVLPGSTPLAYYLIRHEVSPVILIADVARSRRLLAVVDTANGQTLPSVLASTGLDAARLGAPRVIRRYVTATLYEVPLRPAATPVAARP